MQPIDELWCLTDEQGRSYWNNNGNVDVSATPVPLPETPDGWQEKSIKYARDTTYLSLFRSFSDPIKYVRNAAFIIRYILYTLGTEAKIFQVIHRLDKTFGGGWILRYFYRGELDLSQAVDDDNHVTASIMEGGLSKFVKANENTQYNIDIDVPEAVYVKMDGLLLKQKASYLISNGGLPNDLGGATIQMTLLSNEAVSPINAVTQNRVKTGNSAGALWGANTYFLLTGSADTQVTINWDFNVYLELATGVGGVNPTSIILQLIELESDTVTNNIGIQTLGVHDPILIYNHKHHFQGSFTTTIPAGRRVMLYVTANQNRDFTYFTYDNDGTFDISYTYIHRTTYVKCLRLGFVAQKLLDKMTGGGYQFVSNYLTQEWFGLLLSCGDAIRGFTGSSIRISWSELFKSVNVPSNICSGQRNQQLYIERKADAFQSTILLNLGEGKSLTISQAKDYQINRVQIGYPNTDTEDVNGRDEFNVTQLWTSSVTKGANKMLDLVSIVKASMYEIELLRINTDGKTTTDDNADRTPYFIDADLIQNTGNAGEPAIYYNLRRDYNQYVVSGLISSATAFNVRLHPELCLRRHSNYLASVFFHVRASTLNFESSDKNASVVMVQGGQTIVGQKKIPIVTFGAPLFLPFIFNVESPMPDNTIPVMDAGPDGTFQFSYNGEPYLGFPLEVAIQPANKPSQETTMLCSPVTDLSQLISMSR